MRRKTTYDHCRFSVETLREAIEIYTGLVGADKTMHHNWATGKGATEWHFDSLEEFFASYRSNATRTDVIMQSSPYELSIHFTGGSYLTQTSVSVSAPTRQEIEKVFWCFERDAESARIPIVVKQESVPEPVIFIGHGRSRAWRDLKDHLVDQHGYRVEAYETGTRSGHTIRDILDDMLNQSSFALLVLTGEDAQEGGNVRARQNVVHELGLFQGKLGFSRAIAIVEEGVEFISNMDGVQQIRFPAEGIRQVYGDVLAVLRREFG
ncbi:nucleotide-binding protein [Streptomyces scabiei]|uniref:nucleotide-binding protein n=1 Tax=Streptomyces scabiei TaxID=1930 RepID=UPI0029906B62|nr:nucleotide-binding protein [Streptomyces scabiei]MDW8807590.1 nucleotide-binding protein [Streptomyces scabiei]